MRHLLTAAILLTAATAHAGTIILEAEITFGDQTFNIMEQPGWGEGHMIMQFGNESWMHFEEWNRGSADGISFSFGSRQLPSSGHILVDTMWTHLEAKRITEGGNFLVDGTKVPYNPNGTWATATIEPGLHRIEFSEMAGTANRGSLHLLFDPVPEPSSVAILLGGVVLAVVAKRYPLIGTAPVSATDQTG